jgi:hypothetical protein
LARSASFGVDRIPKTICELLSTSGWRKFIVPYRGTLLEYGPNDFQHTRLVLHALTGAELQSQCALDKQFEQSIVETKRLIHGRGSRRRSWNLSSTCLPEAPYCRSDCPKKAWPVANCPGGNPQRPGSLLPLDCQATVFCDARGRR